MSITRIICPGCGFVQVYCTCEEKYVHPSTYTGELERMSVCTCNELTSWCPVHNPREYAEAPEALWDTTVIQ